MLVSEQFSVVCEQGAKTQKWKLIVRNIPFQVLFLGLRNFRYFLYWRWWLLISWLNIGAGQTKWSKRYIFFCRVCVGCIYPKKVWYRVYSDLLDWIFLVKIWITMLYFFIPLFPPFFFAVCQRVLHLWNSHASKMQKMYEF